MHYNSTQLDASEGLNIFEYLTNLTASDGNWTWYNHTHQHHHYHLIDETNEEDIEIDHIPITALVLGLAALSFFVLLMGYIIIRVHCCPQRSHIKSIEPVTIPHQELEEAPPRRFSSLHNLAELIKFPGTTGSMRLKKMSATDLVDLPESVTVGTFTASVT